MKNDALIHRDIHTRLLNCGIPVYADELEVGDNGDFTFCVTSCALRFDDLDLVSAEFDTKVIDFGAPQHNSYMPKKGFNVTVRNPK